MTLLGVMATFLAFGGGVIGFASVAEAAPTLTVTPDTNLTQNQVNVVSVSGSGFSASGIGAIVECNSDPNQPTIAVSGTQVPVGCSNPLNAVHTTNASGDLPAANFNVASPTPGPPATGTDSGGGDAATDAAKYPCPPTQAQVNVGDTCTVGYGTQGGASASQIITFTGQPVPQTSVTGVLPNAGPLAGGTTVTITGNSLSNPTAVSFGGVAATSFTGVSATSVTAVAPASATSKTVDVQVTTASGQSPAVAGDSFTYTNAPLVYALSPTSGPPAGGTSVTLTGGQFTGTTVVDFGSTPATSFKVNSATSVTATSPAGTGTVDVTATNASGKSVISSADKFTYQSGYRLVASDGGVFTYGPLTYEGSAGGTKLNAPIVGMATTADGAGYWLVASDGGVFSYGDAVFHGSAGGTKLNKPIVGIAATADGGGYWLVASDGGVFSYGDAVFHGSAGSLSLNKPIVGIAATADGGGYWLAASDGGVFSYGDAVFQGSAGSLKLNAPVVGLAATADGGGYWLVASDGGIFNYGDATFFGSAGGTKLNAPIVGMSVSG